MDDDASAVSQLILRERQGRDRSWWDQMRTCYLPDSVVRVSWFHGSGPEFVEQSIVMAENGHPSVHRMSPPIVSVHGDHAVAEAPAAIEARTTVDGIEVDLVSYTRLLVRAERDGSRWRIRSLEGIYERDVLTAAVPGAVLEVDPADVAQFRSSYRCLAWLLSRLGYPVDPDLPGDDRPDVVARMYAEAHAWLNGGVDAA